MACHRAVQHGLRVSHLLTMMTEGGHRSAFHGVPAELLDAQSEALGIPIITRRTTTETYEQEFKSAICELRKTGVEGGVFGDIDIQEHQDWVDRVCRETGVQPLLPLWGYSQLQLLNEFMSAGFQAVVVAAKAELFAEEWVGSELDSELLAHLCDIGQNSNISVCGEAGEYHTLVLDGPLFEKRLEILDSRKVSRKGYHFLDVTAYELRSKSVE